MNSPEPSRDQLLAMAYVDGELEESARAAFDQRLAREPALRREVSQLQELELLARSAAPPEPMDFEWAELGRDPLQRGALGLGWLLAGLGLVGLLVFGIVLVFVSGMPLLLKALLAALLVGVGLLFGATLRARLRTLPLDPYRKIQR